MLRSLIASVFAVLLLVSSGVEAAPTCTSKDEEIQYLSKGESEVQVKKLDAEESKALAKATGAPFPETYSYVLTWIDAQQYDIAVISVFDEHNCLATRARVHKAVVKDFIGAES